MLLQKPFQRIARSFLVGIQSQAGLELGDGLVLFFMAQKGKAQNEIGAGVAVVEFRRGAVFTESSPFLARRFQKLASPDVGPREARPLPFDALVLLKRFAGAARCRQRRG